MSPLVPGEVLPAEGTVELNPGRPCTHLVVENAGDRPVQVGSHYHFAAANPALRFDRAAAWGLRLDIPAGTAVRFEPGVTREVALVPLAGRRMVPGLRAELAGPLDGPGTPRTAAGGPAAGGPAAGGPAAGGPGGGGADRG